EKSSPAAPPSSRIPGSESDNWCGDFEWRSLVCSYFTRQCDSLLIVHVHNPNRAILRVIGLVQNRLDIDFPLGDRHPKVVMKPPSDILRPGLLHLINLAARHHMLRHQFVNQFHRDVRQIRTHPSQRKSLPLDVPAHMPEPEQNV